MATKSSNGGWLGVAVVVGLSWFGLKQLNEMRKDEPPPKPFIFTPVVPVNPQSPGNFLNCADFSEPVWVGNYDPNHLDADHDGWGCEPYP
jgi:hypothetical protein